MDSSSTSTGNPPTEEQIMAMILRSTSLAISQIASMKDGAEKLRILNSRSEEELTWTEINMLLQQKKKDVKELAVFAEEVAKLNAAMKSRRAAKQSSRNTTAETQISMSASSQAAHEAFIKSLEMLKRKLSNLAE